MVYRQQKQAQASLFPVCREGHDSSPQTINRSDVESSQKIPPHTEAMDESGWPAWGNDEWGDGWAENHMAAGLPCGGSS